MTISRWMNRKEASRYLAEKWGIRRAPSTMAKLAWSGEAPSTARRLP